MSYKQYGDYKESEIHWAMQIPTHWNISKLKRIFKFEKGKNSNILTEEYVKSNEGPYPVYSGQTKNNGILGSIDSYEYDFKNNVILVTTVGAKAMTTFLIKNKLSLSQNCALIKLKSDDDWSDYYYYLCKILFNYERGLIPDIMQPSLRIGDLNMYNIIKPPLEEQKQIANYLDKKTAKIDATIAKNEELIQLLEEKRVALINQVVTKGLNLDVPMKDSGVEWIGEIPEHWEIDCLKHNVSLNAMTLTDTTDNNYEFDYVDIGSVSLENGIEKYEHMHFEDAPSRARRIVKKDDVIISTVRTYLKAIAIIPDKKNIIVSTGFAVLTPTKINSRYLGYMVKSEYFTNLVSAYSVGVSYPAINSTDLINLDILIPSDEEQKQIADYLDAEISDINTIINKVSDNIRLLEEYKTSLIHHVVTGKIDVRGEEI